MSPFNGDPQGFSLSALALLDRGLTQIWQDMHAVANANASAALQTDAAERTAPSVTLEHEPAPAIAK